MAQTDPAGAARRILRFGVFELDVRAGELRKHGVKLRLQGKPLQVLLALLEKPGEIVTREELRSRLWSSDVFVDVESGLNTAANRLRIVLGDSADSPRYIETLARVGYRFVAPVEVVEHHAAIVEPRRARRAWPSIAAAAVIAALVATTWFAMRRDSYVEFQFRQITFRHGQIWGARFAPDARSVLYTASWDNGPRRLFLTYPSSPESRPLGFDDLRLVAVSRTGELAVLSFDGTLPTAGGTLSRVPMNGGAPAPVERNVMSADWSPDGRQLLAATRASVYVLDSGAARSVRIPLTVRDLAWR
jgi:DNA-binding winged helix-turn-helix (wHTH) protein